MISSNGQLKVIHHGSQIKLNDLYLPKKKIKLNDL